MCGITGEVGASRVFSEYAERQLATLRHRGPDSLGLFRKPHAWIGQTRLAIIDLRTGDPPIVNEDGHIGAVLNGEIYNFRELHEMLVSRGHRFSSVGDTEVLVHLVEDHSAVELARLLDGMFAFAIWDDRRRRLILGRDRFGKKPLFYWHDTSSRLVFGSEIKSLLANPAVPRRLSADAIPSYLTLGYVPTPDTFFEEIRSLPPAHVLTMEPGEPPRIEPYWSPPLLRSGPRRDRVRTMQEAVPEVRRLLRAAVRRRLTSDVPLGAFLSGGLDSTTVVGLMARELGSPVQTFTIGFEDSDGYDERPFARAAAEAHHTDHHEFVLRPDAVELIGRLVWHHDQPFGDSSAIPTFLLCELTRKHVTVALSGDGGDELFAGYERFGAGVIAGRSAALPAPIRQAVAFGLNKMPEEVLGSRGVRVKRFAQAACRGLPDAFRAWVSYVGDPEHQLLLNGRGGDPTPTSYRGIWDDSRGAHLLDRLLDLNLRTYLVDDLLVKADRMSMAHGLEVRSPFLDAELHRFTATLAPHLKARGLSLKRVLRQAVADLVPEEIMTRPKRGFGVPLDRWFRGELSSYVNSTLGRPTARIKKYVAPDAVDMMLQEHATHARNHGHGLWCLLTLEEFLSRHDW